MKVCCNASPTLCISGPSCTLRWTTLAHLDVIIPLVSLITSCLPSFNSSCNLLFIRVFCFYCGRNIFKMCRMSFTCSINQQVKQKYANNRLLLCSLLRALTQKVKKFKVADVKVSWIRKRSVEDFILNKPYFLLYGQGIMCYNGQKTYILAWSWCNGFVFATTKIQFILGCICVK